jgi:hypothetical protein
MHWPCQHGSGARPDKPLQFACGRGPDAAVSRLGLADDGDAAAANALSAASIPISM